MTSTIERIGKMGAHYQAFNVKLGSLDRRIETFYSCTIGTWPKSKGQLKADLLETEKREIR